MYNLLLKTLVLCLISPVVFAGSVLSITPQNYSNRDQNIALGSTLTVPYQINNYSNNTLYKVSAKNLPVGVSSTVCPKLAPNSSCILNLKITPKTTSKPRIINSDFKVCAMNHPRGCTWVAKKNRLNIAVTNTNTFLAITDIHLKDGKTTDITYGQDTNDALWNSTRNKLSDLVYEQVPQFILLLGDLPAHRDRPNLEKNIGAVLRGFSGLNAIEKTKLPVFFVFGNNDSLVVNYGPFSDGTSNLFKLDPEKGWPALNTNPDCSVSPRKACTYTTTSPMPSEHAEDMEYAQTRGYYSAYPVGKKYPLRFISLNSVIFSHEYYQSGTDQLNAAQAQMDWLERQLTSARANNEAVYIAMHIPVGTDAFNHGEDMWNHTLSLNNGLKFRDAFLELMSKYKSQVRMVITGHTHLHELRALYADKTLSNLSVLGVGVPGITPNHYNNPGMQVYLYDHQYRLTEAKTYFTTPAVGDWNSYSFQQDYACKKNSTMLKCVATKLIPNLPTWKSAPTTRNIATNPYELDFSVRAPDFDPTKGGYSDWTTILDTIQVVPTQ